MSSQERAQPVSSPGLSVQPALRREHVALAGRSLYGTIGVYLATRVLLLVVALVAGAVAHVSLLSELGRWDGTWYVSIASHGYARHLPPGTSSLGFFPLLPIVIWLVVHAPGPPNSTVVAGVLTCMVGGLIATLLVQRLASGWWGEAAGRRAAWLFCLFPGSIVFSMVYGEGLLIPLAAGCVICLERRRWVPAGLLAGIATAVQPDALALVPTCGVAALLELRRLGWRRREALESLLAPVLSLTGIAAFAAFLWAWTGTPFATLDAQTRGWGDRLDALAPVHQIEALFSGLARPDVAHFNTYLGPLADVLGMPVLAIGVVLLVRGRRQVSPAALTWTLSVAVLAVLGDSLGPNPRFLITAFPAVVVYARHFTGRRYAVLLAATTILLVITSALTYGGRSLTP